ncbi:MAG: DUF4397 domain-containing protein [Candidatus Limnocylindrales bacterium]
MLRKLTMGAVAAVLSLGVFAAPVGAVDPTSAALLNGVPTAVDVCVGRTEIVSNLRYGRVLFFRDIEAGQYRFVIRKAAPGKCKGIILGVVTPTWQAGENHTSVLWQPFSKLLVKTFTNDMDVPEGTSTLTFHHVAAQPPGADVWLWEHVTLADDFPPTINDLRRGQASDSIVVRPGQYSISVYPSKRTRLFTWEGYWSRTETGQVRGIYLIGTNKKNIMMTSIYADGNVITP